MKCEACSHDNVTGARFCSNCGVVLPIRPNHAVDPMIGQVIGGRYLIKRMLAEGGMGIVYEADQNMGTTVRKVAVKMLLHRLSSDHSVAARFHRECGTVAALAHPNTVKVYDFGATRDGTLYIAMEFLQGETLNVVIEKQAPLEPSRVVNIMRQIAGCLDEAHEQGIIHRDLKPENVVLISGLREKDVVKLLDFGIAARTESANAANEQKLTQEGLVLGTPQYMSPEQFTGKALDRRSDIYSLGVMAYEMVTGQLPFEGGTPSQWAAEHMTTRPKSFDATPAKDKLPHSMQAAILCSLEKERENRPTSVHAFFEQLAGSGQAATVVVVNTEAYGSVVPSHMGEQDTARMNAESGAGADGVQGVPVPINIFSSIKDYGSAVAVAGTTKGKTTPGGYPLDKVVVGRLNHHTADGEDILVRMPASASNSIKIHMGLAPSLANGTMAGYSTLRIRAAGHGPTDNVGSRNGFTISLGDGGSMLGTSTNWYSQAMSHFPDSAGWTGYAKKDLVDIDIPLTAAVFSGLPALNMIKQVRVTLTGGGLERNWRIAKIELRR